MNWNKFEVLIKEMKLINYGVQKRSQRNIRYWDNDCCMRCNIEMEKIQLELVMILNLKLRDLLIVK